MADDSSGCLAWLFSGECDLDEPSYVLDEDQLRKNASILANVQERTGAKVLLALKAFAAWSVFPILSRAMAGPLWGTCASSVDEAVLGHTLFGGETHAFAAAWNQMEIAALAPVCDHIVFNSIPQWLRFRPEILAINEGLRKGRPIACGLRINPEHSEGAVPIYDPCAPGSRLGIRLAALESASAADLTGISGLHFHTLCEQGAEAFARTLDVVERKFAPWLANCQWINCGGGHHITKKGYDLELLCALLTGMKNRWKAQVYIEPGEAVALNAGWLVATVLDISQADMPVAILDVSAACHMPDVLEMPYRPQVWYKSNGAPMPAAEPGEGKYTCRLAGKSCLAGDVIGEYAFNEQLAIGQKLIFADMAIYSMVKNTTFNGLRLPAIAIYTSHGNSGFWPRLRIVRKFGYEDFKSRLS